MDQHVASDAHFRVAFESAKDAIIIADEAGAMTLCNRSAQDLFGYTLDELIGHPLEMLMPARFREAHRAGLARFVATRQPSVIGTTVELVGLRKDGHEFPLELSLGCAEGEHGLAFTGIIRDVTTRRQLERIREVHLAVTRVLASSDSLADSAPKFLSTIGELLGWQVGALWLVEGDPPVLRCASRWAVEELRQGALMTVNEHLSFARGVGLPGRAWESGRAVGVADVAADSSFRRASAAAADGVHGAFAFPILVGDEVIGVLDFETVEVRSSSETLAMMGALGSQLGHFVQGKRVEDALLEHSQNLATTLDSIAHALIATDASGRVTRMNPIAERLTGCGLAEAAGKPVAEVFRLVDETTRAVVECPVGRVLQDGVVVGPGDLGLLLGRGDLAVPITGSCAPIRSIRATVTGAVLVFRDASDDRRAQRAQETAQAQLMLADRLASVGTLAAGVAHEVNSPLAYVIANLEMIAEELRALAPVVPAGTLKDLVDMSNDARHGAERVRKIVRGLKTFSRADEGRRVPLDVRTVLELSINMTFTEIRHRARLVEEYGPIPRVEADDARLGQVFINLLVNAAQSIAEGDTDRNEIRIVTSTDPEGRAVIEVRDTGAGIPAAMRARIFDPFFTTKPVGVGTGLGLSICHTIVTSWGGTISVESEPGRGSTFRVVLLAAGGDTAASDVRLTPRAPEAALAAHILVIDDDEMVGMAVRRVLRGHDVTVCTSGREALEVLSSSARFDVILCDLMMPEMTGMQLHAELARRDPQEAARVIFITGGAFTPTARAFLDTVPNERMEKPFDPHNLRALIQRSVR